MKKRILSLLLSAGLLLGSVPLTANAYAAGQDETDTAAELIVTLDSPSLLDYADDEGCTVRDLILSDKGSGYSGLISSQQMKIKQLISSSVSGADLENSRSFNALTNAFTVRVPLSQVDAVRRLEGVKSVRVSESETAACSSKAEGSDPDKKKESSREETPETENDADTNDEAPKEYDTYGMASKSNTNVSTAYDRGYTGKGTLIAVIDSEFDVDHDVFAIPPPEMKYNRKYIAAIAGAAGLGVSPKYGYRDIFYNGKIIYAYDYGENDNDCGISEGMRHGTHVSGIAAGNNEGEGLLDFKGMAYDAQLAMFKVTDSSGRFREEAIISALDDAIKLGPDVINCSYGAVQYLTRDIDGRYLYNKAVRSGIALISAAGNDAYNGYGIGADKVPASYSTYGTVCTPSTSEGAFSVASSVPDDTYYHRTYMVFNGSSGKIYADMIYADLSFEDVYKDAFLSSQKTSNIPDDDDEGIYDDEIDKVKYVFMQGKGSRSDFEALDVSGKLIILNESGVSIEKLVKNAVDSGCYAVAIIRKEKNSRIPLNTEVSDFFVYAVDSSQKDYFIRHPKGKVSIYSEDKLSLKPKTEANTISEYSSFGAMADLTLKPDITAPGDDILSSIADHQFDIMSGTSMSTPCMSGAYVIIKQYLTEKGMLEGYSPAAGEELIYKLMMSSASLIQYKDSNTAYYSPRLQGAGLVDIDAVLNAEAYLSSGDRRPSVSLREIKDGSFSFEFTVESISDNELSYIPLCILQTDGYKENDDKKSKTKYLNSFEPVNIRSHADITFEVNGQPVESIKVEPHSKTTVKVSGTIDSAFIDEYTKIFSNGFFAEGFICLRAEDEGAGSLNMPFSGFCGDWSSQRLFPRDIYDNDPDSFPYSNSILSIGSSFNPESSFFESAGVNIFGYEDLPYVISFGRNSLRSYLSIPDDVYTTPSVLLPSLFILRDALDYTITFTDMQGSMLFCQNFGDISGYISAATPSHVYFTDISKQEILHKYYEFADSLEEGVYKYMLSASTVGADGNPERSEALSFRVAVDNSQPKINDYYLERTDEGKLYLNVYASDNNYLQGIRLFAVQYDENMEVAGRIDMYEDILSYWGGNENFVTYEYDRNSRLYHFRYDLTKYKKFIKARMEGGQYIYKDDDLEIIFQDDKDYSGIEPNHILIEAVDCAYNCSNHRIVDIDSYGEAEIKLVDESGSPIKNVTLVQNGAAYESDENGNVIMKNLPLGSNRLRILFDYTCANGDPYVNFRITKKENHYAGVFELAKIPEESSEPEENSKAQTSRFTFDTSDTRSAAGYAYLIILAGTVIMLTGFICKKRKQR